MKNKSKNSISQSLIAVLITAACILFAFVLVWPLWKFATTFSKAYTIIILSLIAAGIIYLIIKKIRKTPVKKTIIFITNFILAAAGLCLGIFLLIMGKRFLFFIVILIDAGILISVNILLKKLIK